MSRRRKVSKHRAERLGRPSGRARLVEVFGHAYEVLDLPIGGQRVFRVELEYVEPGSPEWNAVQAQLEFLEFRKREDRGEVQPGEPRRVPPHRPGRPV